MPKEMPFTFTWSASVGPQVERFQTIHDLAAFLAGWCQENPQTIQTASMFDWRG